MVPFIISSVVLLCLDMVFLYFISSLFSKQIYEVQQSAMKINFVGAFLSYFFLIAGLNYFIISERRTITDAFMLGVIVYGVYETTSYALLKNWKLKTVLIDTLWGGILFSLTTFITLALTV